MGGGGEKREFEWKANQAVSFLDVAKHRKTLNIFQHQGEPLKDVKRFFLPFFFVSYSQE
jgi:hypothetical protein